MRMRQRTGNGRRLAFRYRHDRSLTQAKASAPFSACQKGATCHVIRSHWSVRAPPTDQIFYHKIANFILFFLKKKKKKMRDALMEINSSNFDLILGPSDFVLFFFFGKFRAPFFRLLGSDNGRFACTGLVSIESAN